jgi:Fe-S-cluster-containing hydrogenase component 2
MLKSICPRYCPAPFCQVACPSGAITIAANGKNENICLDTDKCNGCGICRVICMTWSLDKTLERKLPWVSARMG